MPPERRRSTGVSRLGRLVSAEVRFPTEGQAAIVAPEAISIQGDPSTAVLAGEVSAHKFGPHCTSPSPPLRARPAAPSCAFEFEPRPHAFKSHKPRSRWNNFKPTPVASLVRLPLLRRALRYSLRRWSMQRIARFPGRGRSRDRRLRRNHSIPRSKAHRPSAFPPIHRAVPCCRNCGIRDRRTPIRAWSHLRNLVVGRGRQCSERCSPENATFVGYVYCQLHVAFTASSRAFCRDFWGLKFDLPLDERLSLIFASRTSLIFSHVFSSCPSKSYTLRFPSNWHTNRSSPVKAGHGSSEPLKVTRSSCFPWSRGRPLPLRRGSLKSIPQLLRLLFAHDGVGGSRRCLIPTPICPG